jgi:hypothetical protein
MSNHNIKPLHFIDTTYMAPELIRHLSICRNLNRQLWQEVDEIKEETDVPKVICDIASLKCAASNGVCRECELSRKIEAAHQSERSKCTKE